MVKDRLSPAAWIDAGLARLAVEGPLALRAEPLARYLDTTKGSFYWHFKDVPDFQAALLAQWQDASLNAVLSLLAAEDRAPERLRRFGRVVAADPADPALRAWAHADRRVAETIAVVDAERLQYLASVLGGMGITNSDYPRAAYGSLIGLRQVAVDGKAPLDAYTALIDLILALR